MKKFICESRYYDDGSVYAHVVPATSDHKEGLTEEKNCDVWIDIFDTKEEAEDYKKEALNDW